MKKTTRSQQQTSDEGATLVFIAVVLVALLALTAFAVDFGRMWEERRQLQNGADAAALAIAEDCARGLCDGAYDEYAVAEIYVDDNARDSFANAWLVDLDLGAQTVTVHNRTEDPGGDHKFDMLFAGIVGFDGFTVGADATVAWGSQVAPVPTIPIIISECEWQRPYWEGGAGGLNPPQPPDAWHLFDDIKPGDEPPVLAWADPPAWWLAGPETPLVNSAPPPGGWGAAPTVFDLDQDDDDDTEVRSLFLISGEDPAPVPVVLTFHDGASTDRCAAVAGQDTDGDGTLSGGFGWLDIDDSVTPPCVPAVYEALVGADPGASPSTGCSADDLANLLLGPKNADGTRNGTTVFVPYFDDEKDLNGANGVYQISGYGPFHIVGYNFGSGQFLGYAAPLKSNPCRPGGLRPLNWTSGNDERCLVGYFTNRVYHGSGEIGPGGHGITVIKFTS